MAIQIKRVVSEWWKVGALTGALAFGLSKIRALIPADLQITFSTVDVNVKQQIAQGISNEWTSKAAQFFLGNGGLGAFAASVLAGIVFVVLGRIIVGMFE